MRLLTGLFFSFLVRLVVGAGIAVHLTVATRIGPYLPVEIQSRFHFLLAGAFYPDALYGCMGKSDYAEAAHWPPFIQAAVELYLEMVSNGVEDNELADLRAFLYGIFTHQVADVSWHSLDSRQGLMQMLAVTEFGGHERDAHTFLDTAGDFITLAKMLSNTENANDIQSFFQTSWEYPADLILQIYRRLGYSELTKSELRMCMLRGYAGLQGEVTGSRTSITAGRLGYYLEEYPLADDVLEDYFYGGVDEIISSVRVCLRELDNWFAGEISDDPWELCSVFNRSRSRGSDRSVISTIEEKKKSLQITSDDDGTIFLHNGIPNSLFGYSLKVGKFLNGKPALAVGAPLEDISGSTYVLQLEDIMRDDSSAVYGTGISFVPYNYTDLHFPPRFGYSMSSWTLVSGVQLLAVSETGSSSIRLFSQGRPIAVISSRQATVKLGTDGVKQLGLEIKPVEAEGFQDLIVSSFYSDGVGRQSGFVGVLSGMLLQKRLQTDNWLVGVMEIDMSELLIRRYNLPTALKLQHHYEQLGTSVATTGRFLIVGDNSIGSAVIFDKLTGIYLSHVSADDIPTGRVPSKKTGMFAYNFILAGKSGSHEWVLISSSAETEGGCIMCGAVYLYVVQGFSLKKVVKIVPGRDEYLSYSRFGTSAALLDAETSKVLISGEGYVGGKGAVWEISVSQLLDSRLSRDGDDDLFITDNIVVVGPTGVGYTGFGKAMGVFESNGVNHLAVGMPRYGYNIFQGPSLYSGCVGIYNI
ncbi:DEKNAAC100084 [Brettanomyces naardenensis]|uniref:DEKNAAC100084 n=1 Tax=Brettanomyces naardenensis TaxID=13370 RepID=A0A448YFF6_BRENA|nr:DEKNAAC100084 [Brettanomyces naardenensis]